MKRSEAIAKIKAHFFRETETYADVQAELMLTFFEKELGMKPVIDIPKDGLPTPEMKAKYKDLANQMKGWMQEDDPNADKNWEMFEKEYNKK